MDIDSASDDDLPALLKSQPPTIPKTPSRKTHSPLYLLVREKVRLVLEDKTSLADKRARTCDEADFLNLLYLFNEEGIRFWGVKSGGAE